MVLNKETGICLQCNEQAEFGSNTIGESLNVIKGSRKSSATTTLETVAAIILSLGVIASLICLFLAINEASFTIFVYSLLCMLVTLLQWSFIKVFAEMAKDIREIKDNK
jgi:hypothetical protein